MVLLLQRAWKTRQSVNAALHPKPVARLDMVRLAAEQEADLGGLLGSEIALLPLDDFKQGVNGRWFLVRHAANIQASCINMQCGLLGILPEVPVGGENLIAGQA